MAESTELDLLTALWINVVVTVAFLVSYVVLKKLPLNFRVYYPRRYLEGQVEHVHDLVNLRDQNQHGSSWRSYLSILDWVSSAWSVREADIIEHYGLDSVVLLRTFLLGLKVFVPLMIWGFVVLIPVNKTDNELLSFEFAQANLTYSRIDTYSIANVHDLSGRLWAHLCASYLYTIWTCLWLYKEYSKIQNLRLDFMANQKQRPEHFTVLVRHVPRDKSKPTGKKIQDFFQENYPHHYCSHQVVYDARKLIKLVKKLEKYQSDLDLINKHFIDYPEAPRAIVKHWYHSCIAKPNAAEFFKVQIVRLQKEIEGELANVISREEHVAKAGFVSFNSCWGATICAQTQQSRDRMEWVTEWAPEPRDVYWRSLTLNNMQLNAYRLIVNIVVVSLILFFFIPVAFVQSLANLDTLIKYFPFLKSMIQWNIVRAFCQGYLPGLLLRIVTVTGLPPLLRVLTKFEGHISYSKIDMFAASKYYVFMLVNVFFGNVIIGSLFEQLKQYIAAPTTIPKAFGISIPKKATFFMTYIMVDGWANTGTEILRLWPLLKYHVSHIIFVQSEKDQMKILPASPPDYTVILTRLSLYFLLGLVYAIISPLILPFLCIFFAFGYLVYRNQVMNVYEPRYELAASFWPFIHRNIIIALIIKHVTLMGLFSVKKAAASTPFLLPLPILVICFHLFCGQKFLPAFRNYPLQEAKRKDKMNADESIEGILEGAYLHPAIRLAYENSHDGFSDTIKDGSSPCLGKTENCQPSPGSKKDDNAVLSSTH